VESSEIRVGWDPFLFLVSCKQFFKRKEEEKGGRKEGRKGTFKGGCYEKESMEKGESWA
jgi:hypothetical protein